MTNNVKKHSWGVEVVWAKRESYCGKVLIFEQADSSTPMWISNCKQADWFVNSGKFTVTWIDTGNGKVYSKDLSEGDVFHCAVMQPVKLKSLAPNSSITEVNNSADTVMQLTEN